MKLNNRGWGNKELIISCCIIFVLLLIIVINVNKLYRNLEDSMSTNTSTVTKKKNKTNNSNNNNSYNNQNKNYEYNNEETNTTTDNYELGEMDLEYYKNAEARLEEATRKYIIANDLQLNETGQMIDIATLINSNYITRLHDLNDNSECAAYSFVAMEADNRITIKPYISCTSYTTEGY